MEIQTALLIFIVIFTLAIGFFLGLFLISVDAPFLKKLFQKEDTDESPESADAESVSTIEMVEPQISKPSPNSELVLKVWKEEGKAPVYEVDGNYLGKEALPQELLNFITIREEPPQEPQKPPRPVKEEPTTETTQEIDESDDSEIKMLSVIDEVNEILQRKLQGSALAGKGIHLMENHNKEIRFWVGLDSYDDVEEIPDPEIRDLIDDAVKEWEQNRD